MADLTERSCLSMAPGSLSFQDNGFVVPCFGGLALRLCRPWIKPVDLAALVRPLYAPKLNWQQGFGMTGSCQRRPCDFSVKHESGNV